MARGIEFSLSVQIHQMDGTSISLVTRGRHTKKKCFFSGWTTMQKYEPLRSRPPRTLMVLPQKKLIFVRVFFKV